MTTNISVARKEQHWQVPKTLPQLNLLQQKEQSKNTLVKEKVMVAFLGVIIFASALVYIVLQAQISTAGYQMHELQGNIDDMAVQSQRLELEIGELSSLAKIENYAETKLSMVYPDVSNIDYIDSDLKVKVAQEIEADKNTSNKQSRSEYPLWQSIGNLISTHFRGTASAAEVE